MLDPRPRDTDPEMDFSDCIQKHDLYFEFSHVSVNFNSTGSDAVHLNFLNSTNFNLNNKIILWTPRRSIFFENSGDRDNRIKIDNMVQLGYLFY